MWYRGFLRNPPLCAPRPQQHRAAVDRQAERVGAARFGDERHRKHDGYGSRLGGIDRPRSCAPRSRRRAGADTPWAATPAARPWTCAEAEGTYHDRIIPGNGDGGGTPTRCPATIIRWSPAEISCGRCCLCTEVLLNGRPARSGTGGVAEWLKAADCKSARDSVRWFESSPLHHHRAPAAQPDGASGRGRARILPGAPSLEKASGIRHIHFVARIPPGDRKYRESDTHVTKISPHRRFSSRYPESRHSVGAAPIRRKRHGSSGQFIRWIIASTRRRTVPVRHRHGRPIRSAPATANNHHGRKAADPLHRDN